MRINVALADNHPAVLAGVKLVLSKFDEFNITGTARNSTELDTLLTTTHCDVLVTDYLMPVAPHRDGLVFLADVRRRYPALQIVLFTVGDHPNIRRAALKIGVRLIVNKSDEAQTLVEAVRAVCNRIPSAATCAACATCATGKAAADVTPAATSSAVVAVLPTLPLVDLTRRELEVLCLYASGHTVTQIARHLNRTRQTISAQKLSAMRKCGIDRDVDLFRLVYEPPLSLTDHEASATQVRPPDSTRSDESR
jgi:two-component system capsular synthesis response regulator RcsB